MPFSTPFRFRMTAPGEPPPPPGRVYGPIHSVGPAGIGAYVVETGDGLVALDTGLPDTAETLLANLRALGLDPASVRIILNTHWHGDHAGGNGALQAVSAARVLVHEQGADAIETGLLNGERVGPPVPVAGRLRDGDVVDHGGIAFRVVHAPGQTRGSAVFLAEVNGEDGPCRALFAGDATGFKCSAAYQSRFGYPGAEEDYRRGIAALRTLEFDCYLGGHPHQVCREMRADGNPFVTRAEWLSLLDARLRRMEAWVLSKNNNATV